MNKKILALIVIILIAILSIAVIVIKQKRAQNREAAKLELLQKFQLIKSQYDKAEALGIDVAEAKRLGKLARQAFDAGDYKTANELVKKTFNFLRKAGVPEPSPSAVSTPIFSNTPASTPKPADNLMPIPSSSSARKLSDVKVATLYEGVTDRAPIGGRSVEETVRMLKETNTDLIFRGFWKWAPVVESPDKIPPELLELGGGAGNSGSASIRESLAKSGHYYEELDKSISMIKKEMPGVIFVGAIPAQTLGRIELNPITGKVYGAEETWSMAFDPAKWGIKRDGKLFTKEEFQAWFFGVHPYGEGSESGYDKNKVQAYFPDITNPDFQELMLSWAKRQIDAGADAVWIDMLYHQVTRIAQITGDLNHPAIKESLDAASKIVDEIHKYGNSKGRYVYVGSWDGPFVLAELSDKSFPYSPPRVDFITVSPGNKEISDKNLNKDNWDKRIKITRRIYAGVPVFAFIDWAFDDSQTVAFSQKLSAAEQREALKNFDESFNKMGINFVYPVHGGYMGRGEVTKKLSFGKFRIYDSLAPEFDTYETIKELSRGKK